LQLTAVKKRNKLPKKNETSFDRFGSQRSHDVAEISPKAVFIASELACLAAGPVLLFPRNPNSLRSGIFSSGQLFAKNTFVFPKNGDIAFSCRRCTLRTKEARMRQKLALGKFLQSHGIFAYQIDQT